MPHAEIQLQSGRPMPAIGFGTWQMTGDDAYEGVTDALEEGYRLIDTSGDYHNQARVGEALRNSPVPREAVFVTSKVEEDEDTRAATRERLDELLLDRLDLCLLHRPPDSGAGEDLWQGLIDAREDGLADEIGVSNYSNSLIERLIEATGVVPAVNQVEWTPFGHSEELRAHARERGIVIQAYSPLTRGERLDHPVLSEIAAAHGVTAAQVLLRWILQRGEAAVPKASSPEHRRENLAAFDFELSDEEVDRLTGLNEHYSALAGLPYV